MNPVPIAPTFGDTTDLTIAVNLGGKVDINEKIIRNENSENNKRTFFSETISKFVGNFKSVAAGKVNKEWDAYDIVNQAFDAMQSTIARQKLSVYLADYYVEISRNACEILEFDLATEFIELGYKKANDSLHLIPR